jgi:hypothetical protein
MNLQGASIILTDLLGKEVLTTIYNGNAINTSELKAGIYQLSVQTAEGTAVARLVIE